MDHNGILWFLPCLFMTEVLFFAVNRLGEKWKQAVVVVALVAGGLMIKTNLPWCLNISMVALQFFWLGNLGRENLIGEEEISISFRGLLVAVILIGAYLLLCPVWDNYINMASCEYGNVLGFEVLSMIGVIGLVMLCKSLIVNRIWGGLVLIL